MTTAWSPTEVTSQPAVALKDASFTINPGAYRAMYNTTPFGFSHNLHQLDIFRFESLCELMGRYSGSSNDYYVAGSSAAAGSAFFEAKHIKLKPQDAVRELDQRPMRILLKRPENHDDRFRALRDILIQNLRSLPGGLGSMPIQRIQTSVFLTSSATTTALHFDPEVAFFTQIEGDKTYHVYSPDDVAEESLEGFYARGKVSIGELKLEERDPQKEQVFELKAGRGFHQPQNSPHWVKTEGMRSISYSVVFETAADRALGRTRAFNHYERKLGLTPALPGQRPGLDRMKAEGMLPERFARKVWARLRSR